MVFTVHTVTRRQVYQSEQRAGYLKALETVGFVHILAEPDLVAVSGETAKFLAGGEFPVPSGRDRKAMYR